MGGGRGDVDIDGYPMKNSMPIFATKEGSFSY